MVLVSWRRRALWSVDLSLVPASTIAALAALLLALGVTYWLIRERDDRLRLGGRIPRPSGE